MKFYLTRRVKKIFKLYIVELVGGLKIGSFIIGAAMLVLFLFHLLDKIDKEKLISKSFISFIHDEVSCHKTYIIFMFIFLFVIQIILPSQYLLEKIFNI